MEKIPYNLILGQNETDNSVISYRHYGSQETITLSLDDFISMMNYTIDNKERF